MFFVSMILMKLEHNLSDLKLFLIHFDGWVSTGMRDRMWEARMHHIFKAKDGILI